MTKSSRRNAGGKKTYEAAVSDHHGKKEMEADHRCRRSDFKMGRKKTSTKHATGMATRINLAEPLMLDSR